MSLHGLIVGSMHDPKSNYRRDEKIRLVEVKKTKKQTKNQIKKMKSNDKNEESKQIMIRKKQKCKRTVSPAPIDDCDKEIKRLNEIILSSFPCPFVVILKRKAVLTEVFNQMKRIIGKSTMLKEYKNLITLREVMSSGLLLQFLIIRFAKKIDKINMIRDFLTFKNDEKTNFVQIKNFNFNINTNGQRKQNQKLLIKVLKLLKFDELDLMKLEFYFFQKKTNMCSFHDKGLKLFLFKLIDEVSQKTQVKKKNREPQNICLKSDEFIASFVFQESHDLIKNPNKNYLFTE